MTKANCSVGPIFAGSSHPGLGKEIVSELGVKLGKVSLSTFPDAEISVSIEENVRGRDAFVLQTIARRPNHYLMEMAILVDALKRASASSVTAVIPYFGYARQDRKVGGSRSPITAKLVADILQTAGVSKVLTMDLHAEQIQGFFDIPVDNLHARPLLVNAARNAGLDRPVVVAPDLGSIKLARAFASDMEAELAIIDKRRIDAERIETEALIGSVDGKDVILVDDMVSTGGTLLLAAEICKKAGAKRVVAIASHPLYVKGALEGSAIEKTLVTNTIPLDESIQKEGNIKIVSVAPLFSRAIQSIQSCGSISSLY